MTCSLRPAAIYGEGERRHFPRILRVIRKNMFCFTIGDVDAKCDWVHVDNFVHANVCAATVPWQNVAGNAFFISDGNPINNWEFLRPFVEGLGYDFPPEFARLSLRSALAMARACEVIAAFLSTVTSFILFFFLSFYGCLPDTARSPLGADFVTIAPFLSRTEVFKVGVTHYMSIEKSRRLLRYHPVVSAQEGTRRTLTYLQREEEGKVQVPGLWWWVLVVYGGS